MVSPGRFELPTYGLGNRCSIQLSYRDPAPYVNSLPHDRLLSAREAQRANVLGRQAFPADVIVGGSFALTVARPLSGRRAPGPMQRVTVPGD